MNFKIIKLNFLTDVHFGEGRLSQSNYILNSDTLFSALCLEALRKDESKLNKLVNLFKNGDLLISCGFPYIGDTLYIPKPLIEIEGKESDSVVKKAAKKLKFIPLEKIKDFALGKIDIVFESEKLSSLGKNNVFIKNAVTYNEEKEPYIVGTYSFNKGNGLYIIFAYKNEEDFEFVSALFDSIKYYGLGGKKSSGLGKFNFTINNIDHDLFESNGKEYFMLLSNALPKESELNKVLNDARYQVLKRSGFVDSNNFADENRKKKDLYLIAFGSVFKQMFIGDIYDVSSGGKHPVYRYAKPFFMGVK